MRTLILRKDPHFFHFQSHPLSVSVFDPSLLLSLSPIFKFSPVQHLTVAPRPAPPTPLTHSNTNPAASKIGISLIPVTKGEVGREEIAAKLASRISMAAISGGIVGGANKDLKTYE